MDDLIRRSDALKELWYPFDFTRTEIDINIKHIPAVDAVEVVHSNWELVDNETYAVCLSCECHIPMDWKDDEVRWNFCPNCGARMDGRREEAHNGE